MKGIKQNKKLQTPEEITLKANSKRNNIMLRIVPAMPLEIFEEQFGFDGKGKLPKIMGYKNLFYEDEGLEWFDKSGFDKYGMYHLKGKENILKKAVHTDGFEVNTYDRGKFTFRIIIQYKCESVGDDFFEKKLKINVV